MILIKVKIYKKNRELLKECIVEKLPFSLGRHSDCDLHLDSPTVSRRHAALVNEAGRLILRDLKSSNGITKNSKRISEIELKSLTAVEMGDFHLEFECIKLPPTPKTVSRAPFLPDSSKLPARASVVDVRKEKQKQLKRPPPTERNNSGDFVHMFFSMLQKISSHKIVLLCSQGLIFGVAGAFEKPLYILLMQYFSIGIVLLFLSVIAGVVAKIAKSPISLIQMGRIVFVFMSFITPISFLSHMLYAAYPESVILYFLVDSLHLALLSLLFVWVLGIALNLSSKTSRQFVFGCGIGMFLCTALFTVESLRHEFLQSSPSVVEGYSIYLSTQNLKTVDHFNSRVQEAFDVLERYRSPAESGPAQ